MGIDPVTHKPKNDALLTADGHSKSAANLSHIAQWESARLEAEARLVRESRLRTTSSHSSLQQQLPNPPSPHLLTKPEPPAIPSRSLDALKAWNHGWSRSSMEGNSGVLGRGIGGDHLESPTSTLTFSENVRPIMGTTGGGGENSIAIIEFVGSSSSCHDHHHHRDEWKEEGFGNASQLQEYKEGFENSMSFTSHEMTLSIEATWTAESLRTRSDHHSNNNDHNAIAEEGFTNLLLNNNADERSQSDGGGEDSENGSGSDCYEDNKNYWNSILNLVNSSPSDSSIF